MDSLPTYVFPSQHSISLDARTGTDIQHAFAKELIAGFASAEVDKLFETKGEYHRYLPPLIIFYTPFPILLVSLPARLC
jgi:hypothetical protein